jgi:transcriptional regulator with XRE-family HTH domain
VSNADDFNKVVGATLRAEASFRGLSAAALSRATGIEYVTLGRYLKGERSIPLPVIYRVAESLNMSVGELIESAQGRMDSESREGVQV